MINLTDKSTAAVVIGQRSEKSLASGHRLVLEPSIHGTAHLKTHYSTEVHNLTSEIKR